MKRTKREINAEKIPEDFPIVRRFFVAVYTIIGAGIEGDFAKFCQNNNIEVRQLEKLITDPSRKFNLDHLTLLVVRYGISAKWLLTGIGNMKSKTD